MRKLFFVVLTITLGLYGCGKSSEQIEFEAAVARRDAMEKARQERLEKWTSPAYAEERKKNTDKLIAKMREEKAEMNKQAQERKKTGFDAQMYKPWTGMEPTEKSDVESKPAKK